MFIIKKPGKSIFLKTGSESHLSDRSSVGDDRILGGGAHFAADLAGHVQPVSRA